MYPPLLKKAMLCGVLFAGLIPCALGVVHREFYQQVSFSCGTGHPFSGEEFRKAAVSACQDHIESLTEQDPLCIYGDFGVFSAVLEQRTSVLKAANAAASGYLNSGTVICGFWLEIHSVNARE